MNRNSFFVNSTIRDLSVRLLQDEKGMHDAFTKYTVLQWTSRYKIYATGDIILLSIKMQLVVLFSSPWTIQGIC